MTSPLIGITTAPHFLRNGLSHDRLAHTYIQAVKTAGGIPVLLPSSLQGTDLTVLRERLDGILLSGGGDIDPQRFGGIPSETIDDVSEKRDELEFALVKLSVETDWPLLGICRGMQVINTALGGSLYTDLPSQYGTSVNHSTPDENGRDFLAHEVTIKSDTFLAGILKSQQFWVNSFHHQGIQRAAEKLVLSAVASDGLVEGLELPGRRFFVGVQWHPECLPLQAEAQALFETFIRAAQ